MGMPLVFVMMMMAIVMAMIHPLSFFLVLSIMETREESIACGRGILP
jgi:hypothetical protein